MSLVTRRCFCVLVGLSKLRRRIPFETKKLLFQALVFPHIHYRVTVWGGCSATQSHRVQKAINFAARIVTGLSRRDHITPALESLGWERFDRMLEEARCGHAAQADVGRRASGPGRSRIESI